VKHAFRFLPYTFWESLHSNTCMDVSTIDHVFAY